MSNYDHIWNIIQMFSFYERFFLVLWVIRAAAVDTDWSLIVVVVAAVYRCPKNGTSDYR